MRLDEVSLGGVGEQLGRLKWPARLLLVLAVWLVFMLLSFFLSWKSDLDSSIQQEARIEESLTRLNTQSRLLLEGTAIRAELAQLEAQLPLLKTALPTEREVAVFLERVNEVVQSHQLKLVEFTPQAPVMQEVMQIVPVKVHFKGEGEAIAGIPNFIAALSRQVSVNTFEMSLMPNSTLWQMTGQLNAYAQLPNERGAP